MTVPLEMSRQINTPSRALSTESCPGRLVEIIGRAGLFLAGKVSPELQGVEISISERGSSTALITVATNELGAYRCEGPSWEK